MTNLEWIRTLSAEDLSQWFYGEWLARLQYRWSSSQGGLVIWLKEQRAEQTEPRICDTCRYYNSYIPCGSTPSACKKADKFAEEFVQGMKNLRIQVEPQTEVLAQIHELYAKIEKLLRKSSAEIVGAIREEVEKKTDCQWK